MSGLPLNRALQVMDIEIENFTGPAGDRWQPIEYFQAVMSDYFVTLGIPIVQGRGFESLDAASPGLVGVVNETLAMRLWKDQYPIGRRLRRCPSCPWFTVVGVAKDVKQGGVDQQTRSEFYFFVDNTAPLRAQWLFGTGAPGTMNIVVRTALPPAAVARTIERMVREVDAGVPVVRFREMEDVFAESIGRPRLLAQLLGVFAGLALLLAAIGIYGMLSYMVAERRREIGLRIALGADRSALLVQVMKQGLLLTLTGIVIGIAGALASSRLFAALLFGVQPTDRATLVVVAATILLVSAVASGVPAWRASRLDPNVALRDD
jgi:predicted permease